MSIDESGGTKPLKYVAVLSHVREVTLLGFARLDFWQLQLRDEGFVPVNFDSNARILISAIDSRFLGMRFRELCIAVVAKRAEGSAHQEGWYFAQAFNSSRFFAAVERRLYSTPYLRGEIHVDLGLPASMGLIADSGDSFRAEMSPVTAQRERLRSGTEGWERQLFLPRSGRSNTQKWFFARIGGHTETYAFSPQNDFVTFGPSPRSQALRWLIESEFNAKEWSIRRDATHARTKTFTRLY